MTNGVKIECAAVDGTTLEKVAELIEQRSRVLRERTKDAVISTAINVLVSLRSATKSAKANRKVKPVVRDDGSVYPGWTNDGPRRVLRLGTYGQKPRGPIWNPNGLRVRWLTRKMKDRDLHVYRVTPENLDVRPYYVVAPDKKTAESFERKAAAHRIQRFGNLAKWALGVAMNKLSTRNVSDDLSTEARLAGSKLSITNVQDSGGFASGSFGVEVIDALDYAIAALKGGETDITLAFQKAANKTAGLMKRYMADLGTNICQTCEGIQTPFPDIMRKR